MKLKLMIAATAAALLAETVSAQVFVIGNGLGGECYQKTKNRYSSYRNAEEICTRALREQTMTKGNRAATHVNRGVLRMREGNYEESLADYADALELQPDMGAAYLNAGAAHIYKKDFETALVSLNRAIELESPDLFAAHYNRAIAREHTGDIAGAYDDFVKALELRPEWDLAERQLTRFTVEDAS
ncbi:MAG: tetratricopeptide repeat protein [Pseudomonadota bacterium]|nr:tetratricopeptide repeat protein [Pseudomonadota bacterium]